MTLFAYKLRVMIGALIWREESVRREDFSSLHSPPPFFYLSCGRKKEGRRSRSHGSSFATFTQTPTGLGTCKHMHGLSPFPPWRHVQGSRDHPECFALHCWTVPFSALEEGERLLVAKRWVKPFHCQHPSFTQASVSQGNSLSCPLHVCVSLKVCVCVCTCVSVCEEEREWKRNMKRKSRLDDSQPNLLQFPLHD